MLDSATGWSARILQVGQNMTINLKSEQLIFGVVTQGRKDCLEWVASFKAQTSFDGRNYTDVDGGQEFMANIGPNAKVEVCFGKAVHAKYVRLLPQTWSTHMSMRAAVLVLVQDRQGNPAHIASRSDHCTNSRFGAISWNNSAGGSARVVKYRGFRPQRGKGDARYTADYMRNRVPQYA